MKDENDLKCCFQQFANRAGDLMALVGNQESCIKHRQEIQFQFKSLKNDLEAEYRRLQSKELSDLEERFYSPAIVDAWANSPISSIRWNSQPDEEWFEALYDVQDYMTYWSCSLDGYLQKPRYSNQSPA